MVGLLESYFISKVGTNKKNSKQVYLTNVRRKDSLTHENYISLQLTFDICRLHVFHSKSRQVHNVKTNHPGLGFIATLRFPRFSINYFDLNGITVLREKVGILAIQDHS